MPGHVNDLSARLRAIAEAYAHALRETLGERLVSVALFGSVARGEAGPHSDIDLFVVLEEAPHGMTRRRALLDPARQAITPLLEPLWDRGIYADVIEIIRSRNEAQRFHPVYLDMTEEAVLLDDKDGFLTGVLERLRQRLRELGARRKRLGHIHYWDLKPDFRPGEVIEL
jgi:predicted nucleotidyltransferase